MTALGDEQRLSEYEFLVTANSVICSWYEKWRAFRSDPIIFPIVSSGGVRGGLGIIQYGGTEGRYYIYGDGMWKVVGKNF